MQNLTFCCYFIVIPSNENTAFSLNKHSIWLTNSDCWILNLCETSIHKSYIAAGQILHAYKFHPFICGLSQIILTFMFCSNTHNLFIALPFLLQIDWLGVLCCWILFRLRFLWCGHKFGSIQPPLGQRNKWLLLNEETLTNEQSFNSTNQVMNGTGPAIEFICTYLRSNVNSLLNYVK